MKGKDFHSSTKSVHLAKHGARLRQEDCLECEASLGYGVSSRQSGLHHEGLSGETKQGR